MVKFKTLVGVKTRSLGTGAASEDGCALCPPRHSPLIANHTVPPLPVSIGPNSMVGFVPQAYNT